MPGPIIGDFSQRPNGILQRAYASTIGRTQTSAALLFTLPPQTTVMGIRIVGPTASNAGTNARISIGSTGGGGKDFLADWDVKTAAGGLAQAFPSSALTGLINDVNPIQVTGIYAEGGSASSAGGPWTIVFEVL